MSKFGGANQEKCVKCGKTVYIAEMAKMENQIWHVECLRCVDCNKKLSGANWGGFVPPENKPYCSACHRKLRQAAGNAIEFSGSTTTSRWNVKGGSGTEGASAPVAESATPVKPGEGCMKCGKKVYPAETVKMEGQIWHDNCLRCVEEGCNKKLTGTNWGGFVPPDNKPYCNTHHKRLIQAAGSSLDISGSTAKWNQNKQQSEGGAGESTGESGAGTSSPSAAKPRWGGAPSEKCVKCGKTVYNAEMVKMEGQIWHDNCLRCVEEGCNKKLSGANWGGFVPPDNRPFCKVHHGRLIASSGSAIGISGSTTNSKWSINTNHA